MFGCVDEKNIYIMLIISCVLVSPEIGTVFAASNDKSPTLVRVSGQITPAMFVGDIIITYEYHDKMYQAKAIEFITDMNKNPFYGPVKH